MNKILSVVIPTYNMDQLLARCLDSFIVSMDSMSLLEVIVVNDGSKDSSLKIAMEYQDRYPDTFVVVDKSNGNYGSCINAALQIAKGKYFRVCDADDMYETANLDAYLTFLSETDADKVYTPFKTLYMNGTVKSELCVPQGLLGRIWTFDELSWDDSEIMSFRAMHTMAVKTELLKNNNYYQTEGISYTDTQLVFYSDLYSSTFVFLPYPIYRYFLGRDGQTMSTESMVKSHQQFYINAERLINEFLKLEEPILENKRFLLVESIRVLLTIYVTTLFTDVPYSSQKYCSLAQLLDRAKESLIRCDLEENLLDLTSFRYWRKFKMSPRLIRFLLRIKYSFFDR